MALILVDATVGFTEQDSKVAGYAHEQGKACIIVVNKWDAVEGKDDQHHGASAPRADARLLQLHGLCAHHLHFGPDRLQRWTS